MRINGSSIANYTTKDGLGIDNIWTVYVDRFGKLWVGTEGAGVYIFNGKGFKAFTAE